MSARIEPAPRPKALGWRIGDLVVLGSTRWVIRTLVGEQVELEATNTPTGIWWTTTLDKLPDKETR
ncbi:hypothetical protein [Microbacterium rhizophilus]|uniref:hypothetical protein n=1 Tax=Microbacterium rhizophilus TaxID=3138934 RepID=UPI0031E75E0B